MNLPCCHIVPPLADLSSTSELVTIYLVGHKIGVYCPACGALAFTFHYMLTIDIFGLQLYKRYYNYSFIPLFF